MRSEAKSTSKAEEKQTSQEQRLLSLYEICPPSEPVEGETPEEAVVRIQRDMDELRDCVNSELKVRNETSLFSMILFKVVLPFTAVSAGLTAVYVSVLRVTERHGDNAEIAIAMIYVMLTLFMFWLWRGFKDVEGTTKRTQIDRTVKNALNLNVPPRKEKLTRNQTVNRWIFFCMTWGVLLLLPTVFIILRTDVLNHTALNYVVESSGVCSVGDNNPYEDSETCKDVDDRENSSTGNVGSTGDSGSSAGDTASGSGPPAEVVDSDEVRLDVTFSLFVFFTILIGGIIVTMFRWWWIQRTQPGEPVPLRSTSVSTQSDPLQ